MVAGSFSNRKRAARMARRRGLILPGYGAERLISMSAILR